MYMTPKGTPDPEYPSSSSRKGDRKDKRNLIETWLDKWKVNYTTRQGNVCLDYNLTLGGLWGTLRSIGIKIISDLISKKACVCHVSFSSGQKCSVCLE